MISTLSSATTMPHLVRPGNGWTKKALLFILWIAAFAGLLTWLPRQPARRLTGTGTLKIEGVTRGGILVAFGLTHDETRTESIPQSLVLVDLPTGSIRRVHFRPSEDFRSTGGRKGSLTSRLHEVVVAGEYVAATFHNRIGDLALLMVWDTRTGEEKLQRLYSHCEIRRIGDRFLVNGHVGARRNSISIVDPGTGNEEDQVGPATWELANSTIQELESPYTISIGGPAGKDVSIHSAIAVSSDWHWLAAIIPAYLIDDRPEALWVIVDLESGEVVAERRDLGPGSINRLAFHNGDRTVVGYTEVTIAKSTPAARDVAVWHWQRNLKRRTGESDRAPNASTGERTSGTETPADDINAFTRLKPHSAGFSMPTANKKRHPWAELPPAALDGESVIEIATGLCLGTIPRSEELIEITSTGRWGLVRSPGSAMNRIAESISSHTDRLSKVLASDEVSLFDITAGRPVAAIRPGTWMFSPDGNWLVMNGTTQRGALEIWHLPPRRPWWRAAIFSLVVPAASLLRGKLRRRPRTESRSDSLPELDLAFAMADPDDVSQAEGFDFAPPDSDSSSTERTGTDPPIEWK